MLGLRGNCIPATKSLLSNDMDGILEQMQRSPLASGVEDRAYADWSTLGFHLNPQLEVPTDVGSYLVHIPGNVTNHCIGLDIDLQFGQHRICALIDCVGLRLTWWDHEKLMSIFQQCAPSSRPIFFKVQEHPLEAPLSLEATRLLNLRAGASEKVNMVPVLDIELTSLLAEEVPLAVPFRINRDAWRCPLCLNRRFARKNRVTGHLKTYHGHGSRWSPSGTKMLVACSALYDDDLYRIGSPQGNYMGRVADIMRKSMITPVLPNQNDVDKQIRTVLTASGLVWHNKHDLHIRVIVRRISHQCYADMSFYELLFKESILQRGRLQPIIEGVQRHCLTQGSVLVSMVPKQKDCFSDLLDDIYTSPAVKKIKDGCIATMSARGEYKCLSIDATVKGCFSLRGQANYRHSKAVRVSQPLDDREAIYKILTILGTSGSLLGLIAVASE